MVGADGLHSKVRALAFGEESQFIRHLGYYVSIFTIPNYMNLDRAAFITGRWEEGGSSAQAITVRQRHPSSLTPDPLEYGRRDIERAEEALRERFAGEVGRCRA